MATNEATDADVREKQLTEKNYQNDLFIPSSRHENPTFGSTLFHNSLNKFDSYQKKSASRRDEQRKKSLGNYT